MSGVQNSINSQGFEQTIALMQGHQALSAEIAASACATQRDIFTTANTTQLLNAAENEKTRDLISSIDRENLNRIITNLNTEVVELRNESARSRDRHGVEITMINNQNQNQLQFQQQAQVQGQIASVLAGLSQNIHATNQAINVGGTQLASPTNTNTNIR